MIRRPNEKSIEIVLAFVSIPAVVAAVSVAKAMSEFVNISL